MALTENGSDMVMPVAPIYGNNNGGCGYPYAIPVMGNYGNNGMGFGGDFGWLAILFLFGMMGGWGNGGMGFGGYNMLPWLFASNANTDNLVQGGFNQAATAGTLAGIQTAISEGFANAEVAACNRSTNALQAEYTNEIADLNRSFASQTALDSRLDTLNNSLQNCCCENRLATANLSALVQRENCADREALSNGIRDIIASQTAGTQRILDQLCADKIDEKNQRISALENQVNLQALAASQTAQTAALVADNNAQTATLIQRIAPYPTPSYIVGNPYGYGYGYNNGGCGNFGGFNGNF